jgi:UDP-3-O-[3-hydroxymyristoyl] glucosamine N-acyltransferase
MKLSEIARKLGCAVEGPHDPEITGVAGIDHAKPGHVTFLANRRYFPLLKTTQASAVLLQAGITLERARCAAKILIWISRERSNFSTSHRSMPREFTLPR